MTLNSIDSRDIMSKSPSFESVQDADTTYTAEMRLRDATQRHIQH